MFSKEMVDMLIQGTFETLYMTIGSTLIAYLIGLPIGITLVVTDRNGIKPVRAVYAVLNVIVNFVRSAPFLILMLALTPFTRLVVGTMIGPNAAMVALVVASAPFIARLVESSLKEIDRGVIEAAQSMGASSMQIVYKVMLVEAMPSLFVSGAIAITTILSYSAMAGIIGAGGLGDIAIRYGLYRYQTDIMLVTLVLLVILVQILQAVGMKIAKVVDKRI